MRRRFFAAACIVDSAQRPVRRISFSATSWTVRAGASISSSSCWKRARQVRARNCISIAASPAAPAKRPVRRACATDVSPTSDATFSSNAFRVRVARPHGAGCCFAHGSRADTLRLRWYWVEPCVRCSPKRSGACCRARERRGLGRGRGTNGECSRSSAACNLLSRRRSTPPWPVSSIGCRSL